MNASTFAMASSTYAKPSSIVVLLLAFFSLLPPVTAWAQDVPESEDHPLITRYEGADIVNYIRRDFDAFTIPLGKAVREGGQWTFEEDLDLEGRLTRIRYAAPAGRSSLEVFRNYRQALETAGFDMLWSCDGDECGDVAAVLPRMNNDRGTDLMGVNRRHLTASASTPDAEVYASLLVLENNVNWLSGRPVVQLDVVEIEPMEIDKVKVDAEVLAGDIDRTGHAPVYGIHFDEDRADIKPESRAALDEIAKLLTARTDLALYVVGHTDNTGGLDHNMDLSMRRAESVVRDLVADYGIAADRLQAHGAGPMAPVAPNDSEDGRALNRRVELVKR